MPPCWPTCCRFPATPLPCPQPQQFLEALARQAQHQLPDFSPQGLANSAFGLSKLGPQAELAPLAASLAAALAARLPELSQQEVGMVVAAASETQAWHGAAGGVLGAAAAEAARRAGRLSDRELSTMLSGAAAARAVCFSTGV